jgi:hypothetical protein
MVVSANKRALGIGLETTQMTAVAPTFWIPVTDLTPTENIPGLADNSITGSAAASYRTQPGPSDTAYQFKGNLYLDSIGWVLVGLLGAEAVTGAGPYTHVISLNNAAAQDLPSYTLAHVNGVDTNGEAFAGMKLSELSMTFQDNLANYTASLVGSTAADAAALPTPSYTTTTPQAAWRVAATLGGSAAANVLSATVDIKRSTAALHTLRNVQTPYAVFAPGDLSVDLTLSLLFEAATLRTAFRSGTATSLGLTLTAGTSSLALQMSSVWLDKVAETAGSAYLELDVTAHADAQTTDAGASGGQSPIKATLVNAIAGSIYK